MVSELNIEIIYQLHPRSIKLVLYKFMLNVNIGRKLQFERKILF